MPKHLARPSYASIALLVCAILTSASTARAQQFSSNWGSPGSAAGQLDHPWGIATDVHGFVYVVDEYNHRIQKFDHDGNFIVQWGSLGNQDGQFNFPAGITVDFYGRIYVADRFNNRIQKFVQVTPCPAGTTQVASGICFERKWGTHGTAPGELGFPVALAVEPPDAFGNVSRLYVADTSNYRIQVFSLTGSFIMQWGTAGTGNGQFNDAWGIALDSSRNVYVSDRINDRVQKFDQLGTYLTQWGSSGTGNGQFDGALGVDIDAFGNVFVVDEFNSRIQKFTGTGTFLASFGHQGTGPDELRFPVDLALDHTDPFGKVFIVDGANDRIQVLSYPDTDGDALLDVWETSGLDVNGDGIIDLDLPALGTSPTHKDLLLEIDYLEFHQPTVQAVTDLIAAFNAAPVSNPDGISGIKLHVEVDEQVAHQLDVDWLAYEAIKATHFGTVSQRAGANAANTLAAKSVAYRYGLFAHSATSAQGWAEFKGNDFVVYKGGTDGTPAALDEEEGVLMHEFGHTLGLRHGGGDDINQKPNYFSVMNYHWADNWINLFVPGYSRPLDFSRDSLPTLIENNLSEPAGVATAGLWLYTVYSNGSEPLKISQVGIPIDWNRDGDATDTGISRSLNLDATLEPLVGYNDWASLVYNFRNNSTFLSWVHPDPSQDPPDPSAEELRALYSDAVLPVRIDITPGQFPNAINPRGKGVTPVAILTDSFDARTVDSATVRFGPAGAAALDARLTDVDGDGDLDLLLKFNTRDTGIVCGQTNATLSGRTYSGQAIEGTDRITTVPCGSP